MKFFSGALSAAILAAALATGCSETPHRYSKIEPAIHLTPTRTIEVGESARLTATSENLVGSRGIRWSVSPNVGRLRVEESTNGQTALFTADQPGVYVITASADVANGNPVSADTTVTVHGKPVTSERMAEPRNMDNRGDVAPAR